MGDKWEKLYPAKRGATVSITDTRGKTGSTEMELAKGEPDNPASREDISRKFHTNATLLISEKAAKELEDTIMNLEDMSMAKFAKLLET